MISNVLHSKCNTLVNGRAFIFWGVLSLISQNITKSLDLVRVIIGSIERTTHLMIIRYF